VDRRVFDRNMGVAPPAPAGAPATAPKTVPPAATSGATAPAATPDSTTITVTVSGWINSSTNHPGDNAAGTVVQPVVVNGATLIPVGSIATVQLAQASDGLTVKLVSVSIGRQRVVAVSSSQVVADTQQNAASDAALQRAIAAGGPNGASLQQTLAARQVVLSGARINVPPGTRLTFTLAAPIAIENAVPAPLPTAPGRRR